MDSGTFDYFTEATVGKAKASRGDFTSSEDDNVLVQGVGGDELALGFLPLAYVEQNKSGTEAPADRRWQEGERRRPDHADGRDRAQRDVSAARRGRSSSTSARKAADRPEVQKFVDSYFVLAER